jgi:hypothetical protein
MNLNHLVIVLLCLLPGIAVVDAATFPSTSRVVAPVVKVGKKPQQSQRKIFQCNQASASSITKLESSQQQKQQHPQQQQQQKLSITKNNVHGSSHPSKPKRDFKDFLRKVQHNALVFEDGLQSMFKEFTSSAQLFLKKSRYGVKSLNYGEYQQLKRTSSDVKKLFNIYSKSFFYKKWIYFNHLLFPLANSLIYGQTPSTWIDLPSTLTTKSNQEILANNTYMGKVSALMIALAEVKKSSLDCLVKGDNLKHNRMEQGLDLITRSMNLLRSSCPTPGEMSPLEVDKEVIEKAMEMLEPFYTYQRIEIKNKNNKKLIPSLTHSLKHKKSMKHQKLAINGLPSLVTSQIVKAFGENPLPDLPVLRMLNRMKANSLIVGLREDDDFLTCVGVHSLNAGQAKDACRRR